jgi:hypothetical protein
MKNVLISLLALAAISSAALANDGVELRDSDTYFGKYSTKHQAMDNNAFAVANDVAAPTAFERMMKISEENDHGSK